MASEIIHLLFVCKGTRQDRNVIAKKPLREIYVNNMFRLWYMYFKKSSVAINRIVNRKSADILQFYSLLKAVKLLKGPHHKITEQKVPSLPF